jgi:IS30 family transposase
MKLRKGGRGLGGLASPGDLSRPGGPGHRVSFEERVEIMRGRDAGLSFAEIAVRIGRDRTVIWREYRRNCLPNGDYHALMAQALATQNARRPKAFKLRNHPLCRSIEAWMGDGWSPKLIADVLARDHPGDKLMQVSHETIYQCLYVQTRGSLRVASCQDARVGLLVASFDSARVATRALVLGPALLVARVRSWFVKA